MNEIAATARYRREPRPLGKESTLFSQQEDEWLLFCRCESAGAIVALLSCLKNVVSGGSSLGEMRTKDSLSSQGRRQRTQGPNAALEPVSVFCSANSLTFHVCGKAKNLQASVDMPKGLFTMYEVGRPSGDESTIQQEDWQTEGEFCVNLNTLLECMLLLGQSALEREKVSFSYNRRKDVFRVELLEESGVLSTSVIPGMLPFEDELGNSLALAFRSSPISARIIFKSVTLQEIIHELELVIGGTYATVSIGRRGLEMAVVGHLSECLVSIPAEGVHIVSLDLKSADNKEHTYPLSSILASMKGIEYAHETCVSINASGMMAIQHQVLNQGIGDGSPSFVDFIICGLDEDDEEDKIISADEERQCPRYTELADGNLGTLNNHSMQSQGDLVHVLHTHKTVQLQADDNDTNSDDPTKDCNLDSERRLFGCTMVEEKAVSTSQKEIIRSARHTREPLKYVDSESSQKPEATHGNEIFSREDETGPLDITAPASPHPQDGSDVDDDGSSPEIVYGY